MLFLEICNKIMKKAYAIILVIFIVQVSFGQIVLPAFQAAFYEQDCDCGVVYDFDGNIYQTVVIGNQCWMKENLRTTHYSDGTEIAAATIYDYEGDPQNTVVYGKLYTWAGAMNGELSSSANPSGVQGVCPDGWHLPSDSEWMELEIYLGMSAADANLDAQLRGDIGGKLKETGTEHWASPNTGATNESGFTALPAGCRNNVGTFSGIGLYTFFWTATESNFSQSQFRAVYNDQTAIWRGPHMKADSKSIRCVKN